MTCDSPAQTAFCPGLRSATDTEPPRVASTGNDFSSCSKSLSVLVRACCELSGFLGLNYFKLEAEGGRRDLWGGEGRGGEGGGMYGFFVVAFLAYGFGCGGGDGGGGVCVCVCVHARAACVRAVCEYVFSVCVYVCMYVCVCVCV